MASVGLPSSRASKTQEPTLGNLLKLKPAFPREPPTLTLHACSIAEVTSGFQSQARPPGLDSIFTALFPPPSPKLKLQI